VFGVEEGAVFAGRYRVIRRIGAGAMGAVYEAVHLPTERRRALKILHAHLAEREGLRTRFELEARVAARVDSEFIVDVFDAGVDEATGTPFLAMELLRGEDLSRRLKRLGRLPAEEVLRHLAQAARALDKTHAAGVVHRDLKPGNLFLAEREGEPPRVKVLDFGIAKIAAEGTSSGTTATVGTPLYMAPEQFRGRQVSTATDIHALGMIAYTLLVGHAYWAEEARGADPVAFALIAVRGPEEPASARAARRGVALPAAFDAWFARATEASPRRRFATATEAVRALAAALALPAPDGELSAGEMAAAIRPEADADAETATGSGETATASSTGGDDPTSPTRTGSDAPTLTTTRPDEARDRTAGRTEPTGAPITSPPREIVRSGRWKPWIAVAGLAAAAAIGARAFRGPAAPPPRTVVESPLAAPTSVLACPILEVTGGDEPAGWLGAAAAATVCERARPILGGTPARTLVPAELLALPPQPIDNYPVDPYGQPEARARSLAAARRRAAAFVDGSVVRDSAGFRVELVLRRADGAEMARATGAARALYQAVRAAMDPLVRPELIPRAAALDPVVAAWSQARDPEGALALVDLTLAMSHNAGSLADECARVEALGAGITELMRAGSAWQCAYTLGLPRPKPELPPAEPGSPASLVTRARLTHMIARVDEPSAIAEIERLYEREPSAWARSVLASTGSCLLQSTNTRRASELSFLAVQAEPKNPTGEFCAPWGQLLSQAMETASAASVVRAMQAWVPWDGNAWIYQTTIPSDAATTLAYARRAYVLTPLDAYVAGIFADRLLAAGAREEARGVALSLLGAGLPVDRVEGDLLLVRVDASEARFRAALARAERAMDIGPGDVGWVRVQRLEIAWHAVELANVVGRAAEVADRAVERFLDPEPPPLDGANITVPMRIPAICARASLPVARRCFARFRALRERLSGGIIPETGAFTDGAERYVLGDFEGAARAWRPLLRNPGMFAALLPDLMEATFERTRETELVARLEAAAPENAGELNGATPAMARAARRAAARGDRARARALATRVIEAWSVADETVPAVEQMRRLLAEMR
jgi:serine/threonine protein kinase